MSRLIEIHDKRGTRQFTDSDLPLAIGRDDSSQVYLPKSMGVEGYIGESKGFLFLQPATGSTPFYHNDQQVESSTWIKSGDTTRIGNAILYFTISGDLLEVRVSPIDEQEQLTPPAMDHPDAASARQALPRVTGSKGGKGVTAKRIRLLASSIFLLLVLAATFVLTAKSLEIEVDPLPDSISVKGFPPVFRFGSHFLGLAGDYTVTATKPGYQQLNAPVMISGDDANRYVFTLHKLPGRIDISTTPVQGAHVFVDGLDIGATPLKDVKLQAGEHTLLIVRQRYLEQQEVVVIEGLDRKQRFDFVLEPAWATVTLTTEPGGATIFIDDQEYGQTPHTFELLAGNHTVTFQKKDFSTHKMALTVEPGTEISPATVIMKPAMSSLELKSNPSGATVTVNSVYRGRTPLKITLSSKKEFGLVLSLPGHEDLRKKITLEPDESTILVLMLQPQYGIVFITAEPPEAELYIDGKRHGKATGRLVLTVREHTLEVRAKGYRSETLTVIPQESYSRRFDVQLQPEGNVEAQAVLQNKITTGSGQQLILLGPATFQMGAAKGEQGRRSNEQQHQVKLSRPFYLSTREVSNAEFRLFKASHASGAFLGHRLDKDAQPVVNVSWDDAARYMNWLSIRDGLQPFYREENNKMVPVKPFTIGYRLPFEAEWADAARLAGRKEMARYGWNSSFPPREKSGNYADESARAILPVIVKGYNDTFITAAPVASFTENPAGFFDLDGNVSEWCHDYYKPFTGLTNEIKTDPSGPLSGTHHVVRGASWRDGTITELRLSYRGYSRTKRDDLGFRIARYAK